MAHFALFLKVLNAQWTHTTYFRTNTEGSGQFERTLIIAEENASVSYLEGCTAPRFDTNQLHAAVVELIALDNADIKYSTVQNWYAGDEKGVGAYTTLLPNVDYVLATTPKFHGRKWKQVQRLHGNIHPAF